MGKRHEAKILCDCYTAMRGYGEIKLGKKTYYWDYPYELYVLSKKCKFAFIGVGQWRNTNEQYICVANKQGLYYFGLDFLNTAKKLLKETKKLKQTEVK